MSQYRIQYTVRKLSEILKKASNRAKERCNYNGYLIANGTFQNEFRNLCIPFIRDLVTFLKIDGVLNYTFIPTRKTEKISFNFNTITIDACFQYDTEDTATFPYTNSREMVLMCNFIIDGNGRLEFKVSDIPINKDAETKTILPGALKDIDNIIDTNTHFSSQNTIENSNTSDFGTIAVNTVTPPVINFVGNTLEEMSKANLQKNLDNLLPHNVDFKTGKTTWGNPKYMKTRNAVVRGGNAIVFGFNEINVARDYFKGKISYDQFQTNTCINVLSAISPEFGLMFLTGSVIDYIDNSWNEYMSHPNKVNEIYNKMDMSLEYWKKSMNGGF